MQENNALMKKEIKGETHLEDVRQQIEDCVDNLASQNPYTAAQTVSMGFNIIDKCGLYGEDCRDRRR